MSPRSTRPLSPAHFPLSDKVRSLKLLQGGGRGQVAQGLISADGLVESILGFTGTKLVRPYEKDRATDSMQDPVGNAAIGPPTNPRTPVG